MGRVSKTAPVFSIKKHDAQVSRNIRLAANIDGADDGVSGPKTSNFTDLQLGLSQLKPFLNIAVPFFKDDKTARNSLIGVVALTLLNSEYQLPSVISPETFIMP